MRPQRSWLVFVLVACGACHATRPARPTAPPREAAPPPEPARAAPASPSNLEIVAALDTDDHRAAVAALARRVNALDASERTSASAALVRLISRLEAEGALTTEGPAVCALLGELRVVEAVPVLASLVQTRAPDDLALAAINALGAIGDPSAVPALVHAYFHVYPDPASFALARVGADGAERLVSEVLAASPGDGSFGDAAPSALALLGELATPGSIAVIREALADPRRSELVGAAAHALAIAARHRPSERRAALRAIRAALVAKRRVPHYVWDRKIGSGCNYLSYTAESDAAWPARVLAPALALLGDPTDGARLAKVRARWSAPDHFYARVGVLAAEVRLVRHAGSAQLAAAIAQARDDVSHMPVSEACDRRTYDYLMDRIDELAAAVQIANDCTDGDLACYRERLVASDPNVSREAALLVASTVAPEDRGAARTAILAQLAATPVLAPRSDYIHALSILSPEGCPECETELEPLMADGLWRDRVELAWLAFHSRS